jgi:hypothetical protein
VAQDDVEETNPGYLLWTALHWAAAALHQAERARADFELYQASRFERMGAGIVRLTPDMERPKVIFWADVHFLMIAVKHLDGVLRMLGGDAPRLDKVLSAKAVELRHLLEHWWDAEQERGVWKGYREHHGPYAEPTQVQFDAGDPGDLRIGADPLSVVDLAADVRRVETELIAIEART